MLSFYYINNILRYYVVNKWIMNFTIGVVAFVAGDVVVGLGVVIFVVVVVVVVSA